MNREALLKELKFTAVRSGGPGGQHANKVSSKVQLNFDIEASDAFSEEEKQLLLKNLKHRLTKDNILILSVEESRSQHRNKEKAIQKFVELIEKNLIVPKKRKPTKPGKAAVKKRLEKKKKQSFKKVLRKKVDLKDK
ncbi:MAG: aminoacyl-tRNA hydrolase [Flavobacteriia bacterium]|nr:MAG: aminoacyl-tRNA hydrolase [Flavobacteriia bacterium]